MLEDDDTNVDFECTSEIVGSKWTRIFADKNPEFLEQVVCMYFLKQPPQASALKSCGVLTESEEVAYDVEAASTGNLLRQLWYFEGNNVTNVQTGRALNDSTESIRRKWDVIEMNKAMSDSSSDLYCQDEHFFIKNDAVPCKVLQIGTNAKHVVFAHYNHDNVFNQLWRWNEGNILNVGTGMYLELRTIKSHIHQICLDNSTASAHTKWKPIDKYFTTAENCSMDVRFDNYENPNIEPVCNGLTSESARKWQTVKFDTDFQDNILCTFLIQNQQGPCGVLTADQATRHLYIRPVIADLVQSQLWYKSGDLIINLQSGLAIGVASDIGLNTSLVLANNSNTELHWRYERNRIIEYLSNRLLSSLEDTVILSLGNRDAKSAWHLYNWASFSRNSDNLQCHGYDRNVYFIKSELHPCKVLTADTDTYTLRFDIFEEDNVSKQLWYFEYDRIINFYTGHALQIERLDADIEIRLRNIHFKNNSQVFNVNSSTISHSLNDSTCYASMNVNGNQLQCSIISSSNLPQNTKWTFINYQTALSDIGKIMCIFYIRNNLSPCEFLTGYENNNGLKVRPMTPELIQSQVFYWNGSRLIHKVSNMAVTYDKSRSFVHLSELQETELVNQAWTYQNGTIQNSHADKFVSLDAYNDGKVKLLSNGHREWQVWSFLNIAHDFDGEKNHCTNETTITSLFFIKSSSHPCLVLTGSSLGKPPKFEAFDQDRVEHQLWYNKSNHVTNYGTNMALMVDLDEQNREYEVIMWHVYEYSNAQKWKWERGGNLKSFARPQCTLHPYKNDEAVTLETSCNAQNSAILEFVDFDDNAAYFDKITCIFFIQSLQNPCELLTGFTNNYAKMRPFSNDYINAQQWYWKGDEIVNFALDQVLTSTYDKISLRPDSNCSGCKETWVHDDSYIKRKSANHNVVTISSDGFVTLKKISYRVNQQWRFVDVSDGLANPSKLSCENLNNIKLYVIRSEKDKCPLLAEIGSNSIGTRKGRPDESTLWMRLGNNILNAKSFGSLSLQKRWYDGASFSLEPRFASELYQKWSVYGNTIRSLYHDESKYVTYTGSSVRLYSAGSYQGSVSDARTWKWYSTSDIERDAKLLRCSRCYDKKEEKAAEIISWIPIFGWLYNLGRSIAYGVKNCPDVALSSLLDFALDAVMDIVTVLSMGTASAVAFGVKTGIKLGAKAGIKAFMSSIKAMIKNAVKSIKKGIMKAIKGGFRQTLKRKITRANFVVKSTISAVRQIPRTLKGITKANMRKVTTFAKKGIKTASSFTLKTKQTRKKGFAKASENLRKFLQDMPKTIKFRLGRLGKTVKQRLKKVGNELAQNAEDAIIKSKQLHGKNHFVRCKRSPGKSKCMLSVSNTLAKKVDKVNVVKTIDIDLKVPAADKISFNRLQNEIANVKAQSACVGVKQNDELIEKSILKNDIDALRKDPNAKPLPKEGESVNVVEPQDTNIQHVEQHLFENLDNKMVGCNKQKPCDVYLYTKQSPCTSHRQPYAQSCMDYIASKCKAWWESAGTRCKIGFSKLYSDGIYAFDKKWDDSFSSLMGGWRGNADELANSKVNVKNFVQDFIDEKYDFLQSALLDKLSTTGFDDIIKKLNIDAALKQDLKDQFDEAIRFARRQDKLQMKDFGDKFEGLLKNSNSWSQLGKNQNHLINNFRAYVDKENIRNMKESINKFVQDKATIFDINRLKSDYVQFYLT